MRLAASSRTRFCREFFDFEGFASFFAAQFAAPPPADRMTLTTASTVALPPSPDVVGHSRM
jgi:hypothetical protein